MRSSFIYFLLALAVGCFVVFLFVNAKRRPNVIIEDQVVAKQQFDVIQMLSSQPYYTKLCELDRYDPYVFKRHVVLIRQNKPCKNSANGFLT